MHWIENQSKGRVDVGTNPRCAFRRKARKERCGEWGEQRRLFGAKERVTPPTPHILLSNHSTSLKKHQKELTVSLAK